MGRGEVKRYELLQALQVLGGRERPRGGEVMVRFPGTTVIIGRRHFSRAMLRRVERKLAHAGIMPEDLYCALKSRSAAECCLPVQETI